ncbi:MAG: molybdopterin-dependent oxidoreductase [Clostridiales bacterium]|nr:molybdopterin-dependent oxidoreductase [Clostridiales bacterium]
MKKRIALLLLAAILLTGCAAPAQPGAETGEADAASAATMERYREGELREYEGNKLDPAVGPRDNSIKGIQYVDIDTYQLTIDGLADTPQTYTYDEVKALPSEQRLIRIYCVEGWNANILWQGVAMKTLLEAATPQGEANTVIFHAVDGYTTSLPLQEILDHNLILAYDANGIALPPEMGYPFIFVAEDKWGYKWARWVNRIELSSDDSYQGYWEGYGYSNDADLGRPSR